jgi:TatD DNase family protein
MLVDSHAHLDDPAFAADLRPSWSGPARRGWRAHRHDRHRASTRRAAPATSRKAGPEVYFSPGIHPHEADNPGDVDALADSRPHPRAVAVGETGLDYEKNYSSVPNQKALFVKHLEIALEADKPVSIHCREAHADTIAILAAHAPLRGVITAFSGSGPIAKPISACNFYLSIAGPVTYPSAKDLREVVRRIPLDRLMIETDCPLLPRRSSGASGTSRPTSATPRRRSRTSTGCRWRNWPRPPPATPATCSAWPDDGEIAVVTGGGGFIGSHLAQALLAEGRPVRVVDNFVTGRRPLVPAGAELLEGDVNDVAPAAVRGASVVYHLAALPSVPRSVKLPLESHRATAQGTLAVLAAAEQAGVRRVVVASSSSVYGDTPTLPKHEGWRPGRCRPTRRRSCARGYAASWAARSGWRRCRCGSSTCTGRGRIPTRPTPR